MMHVCGPPQAWLHFLTVPFYTNQMILSMFFDELCADVERVDNMDGQFLEGRQSARR